MKKFIDFFLRGIVLVAVISLTVGCLDKERYSPPHNPTFNPQFVDEQPSVFDYSTTQDVRIVINYNTLEGFGAEFSLYGELPYELRDNQLYFRGNLEPIGSGIALSGRFDLKRTVPAYLKSLFVYSPNLFAPGLMYAEINDGVAEFAPLDINTYRSSAAKASTRSIADRKADYYLGAHTNAPDVNDNHRPNYVDAEKMTQIPPVLLTIINNAFPDQRRVDSKYYKDASMYLNEPTNVWVTLLGSGGTFNSALSYFAFDGTPQELAGLSDDSKSRLKEVVAFPLARLRADMDGVGYTWAWNGSGYYQVKNPGSPGLKPGDYVQLKYYDAKTDTYVDEFPAGTTIGWILRSDGYDVATKSLKANPYNIFYSCSQWNPEVHAHNKNHNIVFNAGTEEAPFICFGFEDMHNENGSDKDCNDVMFHVLTSKPKAIEQPPLIEKPREDVITKSRTRGILAFEDNWPEKGDYDLNDVMVQYKSEVTFLKRSGETDVYVDEINDIFSILHTGANYRNTFGVKMDIKPSLIASVEVKAAGKVIDVSPVPDGQGFILDLCPNVREVVVPYDRNATPYNYEVSIKLKEKAINQLYFYTFAPYNPFISPGEGIEVHLPKYAPTGRVDRDLFGTAADRSDPSQNLFYVSGTNVYFPFAIHLAGVESFVIPVETKSIDYTYPRYVEWVNSNFTTDKDWYRYPANVQ